MLTPAQRTVQWLSPVGLQTLAYQEWGDPENPHVLLCVHGLTRAGNDFATLAATLSDRVRIIAPDMPGRGRSDWLPNGALYTIPNYVAACVALAARADAVTLDWLGTSMGGLIGMGFASLPHNTIRKLILNDIGPVLDLDALQRIGNYLAQAPHFPTRAHAVNFVRTNSAPFGAHTDAQWQMLTDNVLKPDGDGFKLHYDPAIGEVFQAVTPELTAQNQMALWQAYDAISAETLLIRGRESDLLSLDTAHAMQARGPRARLVEIEDVGHAPTFMNESQIRVIEEFLFG
ncbi:MAG: alpha/beta fold hydrolase [Burkholderiaceae bacterium]